jgi:hypothetical protein
MLIQGAHKTRRLKAATRLVQANPLAQVSFKVTTPLAGTDTVVVVPDSVALVLANVFPVAVTQADAALGVKPAKDVLTDCAAVPLFVKTTMTEPSVFL